MAIHKNKLKLVIKYLGLSFNRKFCISRLFFCKKKYELIEKKFKNKVSIIHGALQEEKQNILRDF